MQHDGVCDLCFNLGLIAGLIAEYPNKFVWKRWQTQRFVHVYVRQISLRTLHAERASLSA